MKLAPLYSLIDSFVNAFVPMASGSMADHHSAHDIIKGYAGSNIAR